MVDPKGPNLSHPFLLSHCLYCSHQVLHNNSYEWGKTLLWFDHTHRISSNRSRVTVVANFLPQMVSLYFVILYNRFGEGSFFSGVDSHCCHWSGLIHGIRSNACDVSLPFAVFQDEIRSGLYAHRSCHRDDLITTDLRPRTTVSAERLRLSAVRRKTRNLGKFFEGSI